MGFEKLIKEVIEELESCADPDRVEKAQRNYPTSLIVKGVSVPKLRPIVKNLKQKFKDSASQDVILFAKQLNKTAIREAQQIAFEVLDGHKAALKTLVLDDLLELGNGIDNWVSVDTFAGYLAGPAWREGQISDQVIKDWAKSEDKWWRRAAVVCTVALNQKARGGSGDPKRTLMICEMVKDDKDDMVAKALSWALRELSKREKSPVFEFIDRNEKILPKRVLREVRRKIETGRKYK